MKISYCSSNHHYSRSRSRLCPFREEYLRPPTIEIAESEITSHNRRQTWKPNYPKHLRSRESQCHRSPGVIFHDGLAKPKTCHISCNQSEAWNILKYQLKDQQVQKAHLENVRRNLDRRLQKAKARGDQKLINLLNQESLQLESKALAMS